MKTLPSMNRRRGFRDKTHASWLLTYADLITLILVLFLLIFSFSQVDSQKLKTVVDSFNKRGTEQGGDTVIQIDKKTEEQLKQVMENEKKVQEIIDKVSEFSQQNKIDISAQRTAQGIEIVMPEVMSFDSGKADILSMAQSLLDQIAPMLQQVPGEIRLEGHTDNVPIASAKYPTNWELSAARASVLARYLIDHHQLDPKRFVVIGYGEYRPAYPNNSETERGKNRRVVLTISNSADSNSTGSK